MLNETMPAMHENNQALSRLAVALDIPNLAAAGNLLTALSGRVGYFKVGLELFSSSGPDAVKAVIASGTRAFIDLKLHDIPNTVRRAVRSLAVCGASLCTVHASGGLKMIEAAVKEAEDSGTGMKIIAVTVLTSLDETAIGEIGMTGGIAVSTERLLRLSINAGAHGCVMSPLECSSARKIVPPGFIIVTPGIRSSADAIGDQARIATAGDAVRNGSDLLVVGRPITAAANPAERAEALLREISDAIICR